MADAPMTPPLRRQAVFLAEQIEDKVRQKNAVDVGDLFTLINFVKRLADDYEQGWKDGDAIGHIRGREQRAAREREGKNETFYGQPKETVMSKKEYFEQMQVHADEGGALSIAQRAALAAWKDSRQDEADAWLWLESFVKI